MIIWDLPDLGIELGSPVLQADSLPSEPPRKPVIHYFKRLKEKKSPMIIQKDAEKFKIHSWKRYTTFIDWKIQYFKYSTSVNYIKPIKIPEEFVLGWLNSFRFFHNILCACVLLQMDKNSQSKLENKTRRLILSNSNPYYIAVVIKISLAPKKVTNGMGQSLANSSVKGQMLNILAFAGFIQSLSHILFLNNLLKIYNYS